MLREISTDRLRLINCDRELIEFLLQGDDLLGLALNLVVPQGWTEFGAPIFQYTLAQLQDHPEDAEWWSWLPVIREQDLLIGSCGFKGRPNADGEVEIGYEIAGTQRRLGYGTEAALALRDYAFSHPEVKKVIAHTLAEFNPSTKILSHCGMQQVGELIDPDEGPVWRWEIDRETYEKGGLTP